MAKSQGLMSRGQMLSATTMLAFIAATGICPKAADLKWQQGTGCRFAELNVPAQGKAGFTLVTPEQSGISWTNVITEQTVARHYNMVSGAGVAAGDFDADGLSDLYFCNRAGENALFRNSGNWRFENTAARDGVTLSNRSSTGAAFADVNGDGFLELLVNSFFGTNSCWMNAGNGTFTNAPANAGLSARGGATSLALGDIDGDGDLDLYCAYFGIEAILREGGRISFGVSGGKPVVTGRHARRLKVVEGQLVELGEQDVLYLNDGAGHFSAVAWPEFFRDEDDKPLAFAPMDFGLAVQIRDINEDGFPDIFVCNDFQTPDRIWLNDGRGRFRAMPRLAARKMSYASMGVDFADIDRDGRLDFITVDMLSREHTNRVRQLGSMPARVDGGDAADNHEDVPRNAVFWNRGDGTYAEIAFYSGLAASDWSWTPIFVDVDLDGYEDLLVSTGSLFDVMDRDAATAAKPTEAGGPARTQLSVYPRLENPNAAFRNRGDLTFEDVSANWGFDARAVSHGMAIGDLDNDGDMDVAINCANAAPLIYRNESPAPRVAVRLKGSAPNTQGIGAKVRLLGGAVPVQAQEMISGGRYMSGDQAMRVFAAGSLTNAMQLEVIWRTGKRTLITGVKGNRIYELDEASATNGSVAANTKIDPLFDEVTGQFTVSHLPALTNTISVDLNGDDRADRIIASDWSPLRVFLNENGEFIDASEKLGFSKYSGFWNSAATGDFDNDGRVDIVASNRGRNTHYEMRRARPMRRYEGDLDGNGSIEVLEAYFGRSLGKSVPSEPLDVMSRTFPGLRERFKLNRVYAVADVEEIFGAALQKAKIAEVNWLDSTIFLNRGDHFEAKPLPRESQFAPAFGIGVGDFDGDGNHDIFLAQNSGGNMQGFGRENAGRGLVLLGDGAGGFKALSGNESGVKIYGEQRGCSVTDLNGDGRLDLIVVEDGRARVFRNVRGKPKTSPQKN